MNKGYGRTALSCYAGVVNQSIITNVTALLFVPFIQLYGFSLVRLGLLTAVNFAAQVCADLFLLFFIDKCSLKKLAIAASAMSFAGLLFYGFAPLLFSGDLVYAGIVLATCVFAFSGGMLEVVLSNVADRLPSDSGVSICLLHTAYAWTQVALAAVVWLWLGVFGTRCWNFVMFLFALIPAATLALLARAKIDRGEGCVKVKSTIGGLYFLALAAVFFGYGAEVTLNQWIAAFAGEALGLGEYVSEFIGMALFAAFLGAGGLIYVKVSSKRRKFPFPALIVSSAIAGGCYLAVALLPSPVLALVAATVCGLFVGVLSPGIMTAASDNLPQAGAWMLASLAVAADLGAAALPVTAGALADMSGMRFAFLVLSAVPFVSAILLVFMAKYGRAKKLPVDFPTNNKNT